jgi:hypothetical protein
LTEYIDQSLQKTEFTGKTEKRTSLSTSDLGDALLCFNAGFWHSGAAVLFKKGTSAPGADVRDENQEAKNRD